MRCINLLALCVLSLWTSESEVLFWWTECTHWYIDIQVSNKIFITIIIKTLSFFQIVRTLASYMISWSRQGKWVKTGCFHISANAKTFKRHPYESWCGKCGDFLCYHFLNQSYGCSKSTESEILIVRPMFYSYGTAGSQLLYGISWILLKKFCNRENSVCVCIVLVHYGPFPQEISESVKLALWAVSLISHCLW